MMIVEKGSAGGAPPSLPTTNGPPCGLLQPVPKDVVRVSRARQMENFRMRLPTQRRRETSEVVELRREMRDRGLVLQRRRGLDDWRLCFAPARAGTMLAQGSMNEIVAAWSAWKAEHPKHSYCGS